VFKKEIIIIIIIRDIIVSEVRCSNTVKQQQPNEFDDLLNVTLAEDENHKDFLCNITLHSVRTTDKEHLLTYK